MARPRSGEPGPASGRSPGRRLRSVLGRGLTSWRRSLRTRVVVSIVVLCAVVVGSVGYLVLRQITDGLVQTRVSSAVAEATSQTQTARERLASAGGNDFDPSTQLRQLVEGLVARGQVRGFDVEVVGPIGGGEASGLRTTPGLAASSVPAGLRRTVQRSGGLAWSYTRMSYLPSADGTTRASRPAVAVGSQLELPSDGGQYAVYYLFSMSSEQRTLNLVERSLLFAGGLLLLLVAAITALITRQVVTPIRLARRVAERIASGRLEERMSVSGDDDIARLGTSFNSMADALQQQIRQLVELSRVQRTFVSDVSHELRTPLTTVRMAGDVLHDAKAGFDPVTARAAELLQTELDRFERLLADLLEISRFDAGAAALELERTDLVAVARTVVDTAGPLARQRGVQMSVEAPGPCFAEVDARRVARIVRNLVTNAIDHAGGPGSTVQVRLLADEQATALTVRDHGVGLEPGQSAMVFNRFWRADPARARTTGGSGLGLSISREDALLHGGWLQAWGVPGGGSQFRLTLPARAGDPLSHSPLPLVPADAGIGEPEAPRASGSAEPVDSRPR